MNDPYPHTDTRGPHCSFCGRAATETSTLVQGPDVYICASCVRDANGLVDAETEREGLEPTAPDYGAAYQLLRDLSPPLVDLLEEAHRGGPTVLEVLAEDVAWYRSQEDVDIVDAVRLTRRSSVEAALYGLHYPTQ